MANLHHLLLMIMMCHINRKVLAVSPTKNDSLISSNTTDQFPNPRIEFHLCNRKKPSYICDPDDILDSRQGDKLDLFAIEHRQSTPCLCSRCVKKDGGVQIGVFLKYNLTSNYSETNISILAKHIRKQWKLGKCADDIIIVVFAENKKAAFNMGETVEHVFPPKIALKIFKDCVGHFTNDNYYQGLESMINSFRDVLQRFQKLKPLSTKKKKTGLIIGISSGVGILVAMVATAVIIRCRQNHRRTAREGSKFSKEYSGLENVSNKYSYNLYSDPSRKEKDDLNSSSSDEGIDSDGEDGGHRNKQYDLLNLTVPSKLCTRQLSDVLEDAQEDEEAVAIKYAMNSTPRNCNINVTEL